MLIISYMTVNGVANCHRQTTNRLLILIKNLTIKKSYEKRELNRV